MDESKRKELQRLAFISTKERGKEYINFLTKVMRILNPSEWERLVSFGDVANNQGMLYENDEIEDSTYRFLKAHIGQPLNKFLTANLHCKKRQLNMQDKFDDKYIMDNLELIISQEMPNISSDELQQIVEEVKKYQKINTSTLQNINFNMLDEKYSSYFTPEQLALIISYPVIQDSILSLNDNELECLNISLNDYMQREQLIISDVEQSDWNYEMELYLASLMSGQYSELISEISEIESTNEKTILYQNLGYILSSPNFFNVTTVDELKRFSDIKKEVCGKIINGDDLSDYPLIANMGKLEQNRFAILQHYGLYSGAEMIQMFKPEHFKGHSDNPFFLQVINAIKQVYEIKDATLLNNIARDIYDKDYIDEKDCSLRLLDKSIKIFLEKEYNSELTDINNIPTMHQETREKHGIDDFDGILLDATDMDFKLMVTSIAPYSNDVNATHIENYCDYWNRSYQKAQFFCYSHISNANISTAEIPHTLVGVSEVKGLQYVAPFDSNSNSNLMSPIADSVILLPLNELSKYNQMTEINSKRVSPTYIPLIKKYGEVINYEHAKKASKDFSTEERKVPIVFIDADKIRYKQLEHNINLIKDFQDTGDVSILPIIAQTMNFDEMVEDYYSVDEDEIDVVSECLGKNSKEFANFVKQIDLHELVEELNMLEYAEEISIHVELEDIIPKQQSKVTLKNSQESLEENTSYLRISEIEQITHIITKHLEKDNNYRD